MDEQTAPKPPAYYIGETWGRFAIMHSDMPRHANGSALGTRNKLARRLLRKMFGESTRRLTKGIHLARALMVQAREVAREAGKGPRFARKLYEKELALHQTTAQPSTRSQRRRQVIFKPGYKRLETAMSSIKLRRSRARVASGATR